MVFPGPGLVHVAIAHGAVGAAHANGAHVDVAHEHGHHQHGGRGMHHVADLHGGAFVHQARNQLVEHQTRGHHNQAQEEYAPPEQQLLACIEAV